MSIFGYKLAALGGDAVGDFAFTNSLVKVFLKVTGIIEQISL